MSLSGSLYAGISGLSTMGNGMSVLGDNVANTNTIAFKSSRSTFQDVLSQSVATAAGSAQVGRGVTLTTVDGLFAQGSFESTSTPTDMAIGGEGFFMLRAGDSAEAAMYTRAGEFRFDQQGNLISPGGHFVQGWQVDSETGEIQGTIGDINLGRATPPVATERIDLNVNLDSRIPREVTEQRLFDAWNGHNLAQVNPTPPIDAANYEYTTANKVYDSKGAAHDVTIYFDRTTQENQWEFLVTCDPSSDLRRLESKADLQNYAPNETYNYQDPEHKGAGALMYGTIDFDTSGATRYINAWEVPPDGKVDPGLDKNRITLDAADNYYSFGANFTGADVNQQIELNFGARYSAPTDNLPQILVTNRGSYEDENATNPITRETLWQDVYDANGNRMTGGDTIRVTGYNHSGRAVTFPEDGSYEIRENQRIGVFLEELGSAFGATATIDAHGRIRLTDESAGPSGLAITSFNVVSASGADPFGGGTDTPNILSVSPGRLRDEHGIAVTDLTKNLTDVYDENGLPLVSDQILSFRGTDSAGNDIITPATRTVGVDIVTVGDLLGALEDIYEDDPAHEITAILDNTGNIRLIDNGGVVRPVIEFTLAQPFGTNGRVSGDNVGGSAFPALYVDDAQGTPIGDFDDDLTDLFDGNGRQVAVGDRYTFRGVDSDGSTVPPQVFTVNEGNTFGDLITWFSEKFYADHDPGLDEWGTGDFAINDGEISFATPGVAPFENVDIRIDGTAASTPLGTGNFTLGGANLGGMVNVTTTKRELVSPGQAFSTDTGQPPVITSGLSWDSVYDSNGNRMVSGNISYEGRDRNGVTISGEYTVNLNADPPHTVQNFLDQVSEDFNADAFIDRAGRLIVRDRVSDGVDDDDKSDLQFSIAGYPTFDDGGTVTEVAIFGPSSTSFDAIPGSLEEDGSRLGTRASRSFESEAMSTTQYANSSTTIFQDQDGYAAGFLQSVSVDTAGIITGNYSNGQVLQRAQVALANFSNLQGLHKVGGNIFRATTQSGAPVTGMPGTNGLGEIAPNSLEQSNVDLGTEFVKLITTQRGFQANSKIITTTDEMLNELINIKR